MPHDLGYYKGMDNSTADVKKVESVLAGLDVDDLLAISEQAARLLAERLPGEGGSALRRGAAQPPGLCPARIFSAARSVKHLDEAQMARLTRSFTVWRDAARTPRERVSRQRVWFAYQFIRHTGAKLGEVLGLDDSRDLDMGRNLVRFSSEGSGVRQVEAPAFLLAALRVFLDEPANAGLRGEVFRLDPGHVRRKFYDQAGPTGIPRPLLTPQVLRHSRAVELLREGLPLPAVQALLGHSSLELTSNYFNFSDADIRRLIHHAMQKEPTMKTSARNTFSGNVTAVRKNGILAEVELVTPGGHTVVSVITVESLENLGIAEGRPLTAIVKAPWVILALDRDEPSTSARNRFAGKVLRVNADPLAVEVIVELSDGTLMCALITDESRKNLDLAPGSKVWCLFKAFSVILNVE